MRWLKHVARVDKNVRNAKKLYSEKLKGRNQLEGSGKGETRIIKFHLK
jgi:hypothetical protein